MSNMSRVDPQPLKHAATQEQGRTGTQDRPKCCSHCFATWFFYVENLGPLVPATLLFIAIICNYKISWTEPGHYVLLMSVAGDLHSNLRWQLPHMWPHYGHGSLVLGPCGPVQPGPKLSKRCECRKANHIAPCLKDGCESLEHMSWGTVSPVHCWWVVH